MGIARFCHKRDGKRILTNWFLILNRDASARYAPAKRRIGRR
jgi:hypothetical protein